MTRTFSQRRIMTDMGLCSAWRKMLLSLLFALPTASSAQTIEFDSGGLRYKALTRGGLTVMFAPMALHVREYSVLQVAVSNGTPVAWTVKPEDFRFERDGAAPLQASAAKVVVGNLLHPFEDEVPEILIFNLALHFRHIDMTCNAGL